jgi:transcriptional regulator PpsR
MDIEDFSDVPTHGPLDLGALSAWAPHLAHAFVSLASDIALVLDERGVVRSAAQGGDPPIALRTQEWIGRLWSDTVTEETRGKVEQIVREAVSLGAARRREINHALPSGGSMPVSYSALRLGQRGPVLVVGRDLRAVAAIEQRFSEAHRDLERGYWHARQAESRYRLLFQVATDAVLVVDALTLTVIEANQAASQLFDLGVTQLVGNAAHAGFEPRSRLAVDELLAAARMSGQAAEIRAHVVGRSTPTQVAATPFRSKGSIRLLMRVRVAQPRSLSLQSAGLQAWVDGMRDVVVVTDSSGRILFASPPFVALVRAVDEAEIQGRRLFDWVDPRGVAAEALLAQVRRDGVAHSVEGRLGTGERSLPVDISAALLTEGDQE